MPALASVRLRALAAALPVAGSDGRVHLHFHLMDGPRPLASNGLPFEIRELGPEGTLTNLGPFEHGALAKLVREPRGPRRGELPLSLSVVGFG